MAGFPNPLCSSFGLARLHDGVYIIGGHTGVYHDYSKEHFTAACHRVSLDGTQLEDIPNFPDLVQGLRAAVHGNDVIAFGGFIYDSDLDVGPNKVMFNQFARSISEVRTYSPGEQNWKTRRRMPRPRSSNVAEKIGDFVYLLGGWDGTPWLVTPPADPTFDIYGRFHNAIEIYDCVNRGFVPNLIRFPLPLRRAFSSTVLNGRIVMVGGLSNNPSQENGWEGDYLNCVTTFDPETRAFNDDLPQLPVGLFSPAVCAAGDSLVVVGGTIYDRTATPDQAHVQNKIVYVLKKDAGEWLPNKYTPTAVGVFHELIELTDSRVLVIGGHSIVTGLPMGMWEELKIETS